jgi:Rad3-related DNA helicase
VLPGYEERPAQRRLSEAVADVLEHGGLLLAEAGTGTARRSATAAGGRVPSGAS